ncbi:ParA family protein [Verminephrobacter aporrectodeae subsp. tuberculatae]|nr:ParA family protein [Verminephrobacter aporrectodeae]MCW8164378.1 ParA family protein [Verminephrobacter aporrectodeae subsp. tuberculatae]MCW8170327.1 ParA family protein [Verminephrobacter aporrectodeae subsp. tuberculatae]
MAIYAIWNNKGGVGKSYLTFQVSSEYARQNPNKKVLVLDLCPQANSSSMLLGGMVNGEKKLGDLHAKTPRLSIAGYIDDRIISPYQNPKTGARYLTHVNKQNREISKNLYLIPGDEKLELQASRVFAATKPGPDDAWRFVHMWIRDLIADITHNWGNTAHTVFVDCNPSFSIYTELALSTADRLIIPFSADGSSKRAVRSVLALVYGVSRQAGQAQSEFFLEMQRCSMNRPKIYMYVGNRLTQSHSSSAAAFKTVVGEIGDEIYDVWRANPNEFCIHPASSTLPTNKKTFHAMFQTEVADANTASVVSSTLGTPICCMTAGSKTVLGKNVVINKSQLDRQISNITHLVQAIE